MTRPTHARVRGLDAHRTQTKEFLKLIASVQQREGWREEQALSHWLTAACCSLRAPLLQFAPAKEEANERRYEEVLRQSRHPNETMRELANALAIVTDALEAEPSDFITPVFSEVAANAHWGQFFTPWHLCMVTAQMTLQNAREMLDQARSEGRRHILCHEPACGVGGMILAASQVFRDQGINPSTQVHWVARDLDIRAVQGCYIQTTLTGVSAVIEHGNSLSLEVFDHLHTFAAVMHPKTLWRDDDDPQRPLATNAVESDAEPQFAFDFARQAAA